MKKILILIFLVALSVSGCSMAAGNGNAVGNSQGVEVNQQVVLPTATPYIIYVTATTEQQAQPTEGNTSPYKTDELLKGKVVYSKLLSQDPVDMQIFVMNLNDGLERQLTQNGINSRPVWSPDGTKILFGSASEETSYDIFVMDENGANAHAIVATSGMDINAVWSPDGKMVAYSSDVGGNHEVYILSLESNETRQITSEESGYHGAPSWSADGKKIVYVYGDGVQYGTNLFVYDLETGGREEIDKEKFFQDDLPIWSMDGQGILFSRINGDFKRIVVYDLNQMEESLLTKDTFPQENMEFHLEKSGRGNFVSFSENGKFYVMDMDAQLIYPLGIDAMSLQYFPE